MCAHKAKGIISTKPTLHHKHNIANMARQPHHRIHCAVAGRYAVDAEGCVCWDEKMLYEWKTTMELLYRRRQIAASRSIVFILYHSRIKHKSKHETRHRHRDVVFWEHNNNNKTWVFEIPGACVMRSHAWVLFVDDLDTHFCRTQNARARVTQRRRVAPHTYTYT